MNKGLKLVVIGGGSSYTPELVEGIIKRHNEFPVNELWLVDIEAGKTKLEIIEGLTKRMIQKAGLDIEVHATLDRREALKDADFVVSQIRVGLLDARIKDERIPLKYNVIGQETTGPGGFAKALRTIPVTLDICKDVEELAPNAWYINFTNPSGIITETILNHTKVKAIGLCNVPINMRYMAATILGLDFADVYIDYAGINHLVWGMNVYARGENVTQKVLDKLISGEAYTMPNIRNLGWDPDLLKSLGMLPCPYHRYYYMTDKMLEEEIKAAEGEGTRGEVVKKLEESLFELYSDPNLDVKPSQLSKRGGAHYSDAACMLMSSIYNDKKDIQPVNVLNNGTILDLPANASIEVNCVIDKNGAHPIHIGHVSTKIRGLMAAVKAYEQLTIEAGVTGDYNTALQALIAHPLVPSASVAKKLLDDIIRENIDYLPQFK